MAEIQKAPSGVDTSISISSKRHVPDILSVPTTFGLDSHSSSPTPTHDQDDVNGRSQDNSTDSSDRRRVDALIPQYGYKREVLEKARSIVEAQSITFPDFATKNHYYGVEYGEILLKKYDQIRTRLGRSTDQHTLTMFAAEEAHDFAVSVMSERIEGETDKLTGLMNRRGFDRQVLYVLKDVIATNQFVCLVVGDINGLKFINDTEGHAAGDKLISDTGEVLQGRHRKTDLLTSLQTRYGGDEVRMIMPNTTIEGTQAWFAETAQEFERNKISIGLGAVEIDPEELKGLTDEQILALIEEKSELADAASYAAKDDAKQMSQESGSKKSWLFTGDHPLAQRELISMREARAQKALENAAQQELVSST